MRRIAHSPGLSASAPTALDPPDRPPDATSWAAWTLLASLFATQRMGLSFIFVALVAILRQQGFALERLGTVYVLGLFWVLKCLWAPLVDGVRFGRLGHYRGWLVLTQSGMILTLLLIGRVDVLRDYPLVFGLCALLALFSSTQDIATDALACRLLRPHERGLGNAVQVAGGMLGNLIGGGLALMAYPRAGWSGSMWLLAACSSVALPQIWFLREPTGGGAPTGLAEAARRVRRFWSRPGVKGWLLLIAVHPLGVFLAIALATPMLVDRGWSLERVGLAVNLFGPALGILSAMGAGWIVRRFGRRATLTGTALAQAFGVLALATLLLDTASDTVVFLAVGLLYVFYGPIATALCTVMMDQTSRTSPATDYALQYSLFTLAGFMGGGFSTFLAGRIGYLGVILLAACGALVAAALSAFLPLGPSLAADASRAGGAKTSQSRG